MKGETPLDMGPGSQALPPANLVGFVQAESGFRDETSLIALLETFRPYDPFSNAVPAEIRTAWVFRASFAVVLIGAGVIAMYVWSKRDIGYTPGFWMPLADNAFYIMLLAAGLMIVAYPLFYLLRYRMPDDDRSRHLSGEYVHRMKRKRHSASIQPPCSNPFKNSTKTARPVFTASLGR